MSADEVVRLREALRDSRIWCPTCGGAGYIPADDESGTRDHPCPNSCGGAAITQEWLDRVFEEHAKLRAVSRAEFIHARDAADADPRFSGWSGGQWATVFLAALDIPLASGSSETEVVR